jgi:ubiquinone biosynthesis protein COQ9
MRKNNNCDLREELILAALPHVPFDGWVWSVLEIAACECGHSPSMARAIFSGGMTDALGAFAGLIDRRALERLQSIDPGSMRVRDRIQAAVMARFEVMQEWREAERLALRFWASPLRSGKAIRIVWRTADRIWDWAGDTATDYNRYTKRGLLSGMLGASTLAWLDDDTPDMGITRAFVARRIENVMQMGRVLGKIKKTERARV